MTIVGNEVSREMRDLVAGQEVIEPFLRVLATAVQDILGDRAVA